MPRWLSRAEEAAEEAAIQAEIASRPDHGRIAPVTADQIAQASSPLAKDLRSVLNRHSAENQSDTPDFILAQYMLDALASFEKASRAREDWYGHRHAIGGDVPGAAVR